MIAFVIVGVAAIVGLVYVSRPLFAAAAPRLESTRSDALIRKVRSLEAILDLEQELAAGKISDDDYATFKETYERDAVAAMRELDVVSQGIQDEDLEAEIAAARAELR